MEFRSNQRRVLAIGDVHGCADELEMLLKKVRVEKDDQVVFLGDYIDRGPDSRRVVDTILELGQKCEVVALKGNHEALLLDFLDHPESPGAGVFILNGGGATIANYSGPDGSFEFPDDHLAFFRGLKLFHETDTHFFVHAGVPNIPLADIDAEKHGQQLIWSRQPFLSSKYQWEKIVVHGHTPVPEVEVRSNRVNIDTGCVYHGVLTCLELLKVRFHHVERGLETEAVPYPIDAHPGRISTRFSGRIPVEAGKRGQPLRAYETLNHNQFGLLLRDLDADGEEYLALGDRIEGRIGADRLSAVKFQGHVVRTESRGGMVVYGVKIDYLGNDK